MKKENPSFTGVMREYGVLLPEEAFINIGVGKRLYFGSTGPLKPTRLLYQEEEDVKIAGGLFFFF